ncbi:MAG: YceI family protein [Nitrospinae bacterium]|nr:YceI family protein [Nitrospinota bacterium]
MKHIIKTLLLFTLFFPVNLQALEVKLSPENTQITFDMDTTWHKFSGKANKFSGFISFENMKNPENVKGVVTINVADMTTMEEDRDEKMHKTSLLVDTFPTIKYRMIGYEKGKLKGELTILKTTKPVDLVVERKKVDDKTVYLGKTTIKWKDFGVVDPSIWVAKVYEDVIISVEVDISDAQ